MSFRRFVYYCAVCGAWAAFVGWVVGIVLLSLLGLMVRAETRATSTPYLLLHASVLGLALGLAVALGLSLLDATWNLSLRQFSKVLMRVLAALVVGGLGGLFGGFVGQGFVTLAHRAVSGAAAEILGGVAFLVGWTLVGLLVGSSIGAFEVFTALIGGKDRRGAFKKFFKCLTGGTVGGLLGGCLALLLRLGSALVFADKDENRLLSPTALGFVALGACIGLLVGLAQVLLKEAWIKVEAGFRPGREMILAKQRTSIGRAEGSDVALFGDSGVEKAHAHIILDGGRYFVEGAAPGAVTFVNDEPVRGRTPLTSGDLIRVGRSTLRFYERSKRD